MKELEACVASLGIGLSLGMIGAGGSILTIPVFVYILKIDPLSSAVYSMFVVGISSMAGSIRSMFKKLVDFKTIFLFGFPSVAGVFIARRWIFTSIPEQLFPVGSFYVSKEMLFMLCLSLLMLLAAIRMLRPVYRKEDGILMATKPSKKILLSSQGLFVGIITGLLGIGGGFLIVPALYLWARLTMKTAIGTALVIITINSFFGFLSSYSSLSLDWVLLLKFSIGAIAGILIGAKLSSQLRSNQLKKIFGWFVLIIAVYILYKQFFI